MIHRFRIAPPYVLAAALVPMLALSACSAAPEEGFEEEPPAETAADADTGAGSAIETETAQAEIGETAPEAATAPAGEPGAREAPCSSGTPTSRSSRLSRSNIRRNAASVSQPS